MKSVKLNQSKWARDNHDEDCRSDNMLVKEKEKWVCKCNQDDTTSESDSETESDYEARKKQEELEDFATKISSQLKDEWYRESESDNESVLSEIDYEEQEIEAIKKEQLKEMEESKKEQEDRIEWENETHRKYKGSEHILDKDKDRTADIKPQNHKTTTISKVIPEKKKKVEKKEDKQINHNISIIPQTFQQKWYAVFGDIDLRKMIMYKFQLEYNFIRLEKEVIRKAMYLQDGMLFKNRVHMFNIHLVCSNIYDYHYYLSDTYNLRGMSKSCKSEWERNIKRVYTSLLHNVDNYVYFDFDYENMDYNDDTSYNKDDPNSNKKKYNNGNIKLPFLDLLFNGNKYGSCLMRKKRKEDCPLYLILIGFFDWLYKNRKIDDVVEDEVLGYDGFERWYDFK